jgi:hypothetical protein
MFGSCMSGFLPLLCYKNEVFISKGKTFLLAKKPIKKLCFFIDKYAVRQNEVLPLLDKTLFYLTSLYLACK